LKKEGKMSVRKLVFAVVATWTALLVLAFGSQSTGSARALPESPVLADRSLTRSESVHESALSNSHLVPAVVYVDGDGHIHEIALKGT
jgi:hypothetical protein